MSLIFLSLIYLSSRFILIFKFPLFFDEAIYIHWAQFVQNDWTWKFVSLIDGKQPLLIWLISLSLKIVNNPQIAGRMISVFSGLGSMIGIYYISKELFDKKTAIFSSLIYILVPFFLIYDSLALMDSLVLFFSIISCYLSIIFVKNLKIQYAALLGLVIGLGLLTKSSGNLFFLLIPTVLLLRTDYKKIRIFKYLSFSFLTILIAKGIESILRLSVYNPIISSKNLEFIRPLSEVFNNPFLNISRNFGQISTWIASYLGLPLILVGFLPLLIKKDFRKKLFLIIQIIIPISLMHIFGKQLYPRYFLFMVWPLLVLSANFITQIDLFKIRKIYLQIAIFIIVISFPLYLDFYLFTNTQSTPLTQLERWQFFEGEPSGYGMDKLVEFTKSIGDEKALIITDKPIGILPDGLSIFFFKNKNLEFIGTAGTNKENVKRYAKDRKVSNIYLIISWQKNTGDIDSEQLLEIPRVGERNFNWKVYKVKLNELN